MSVTMHTSHGDLKIELYTDDCPLACFNFLGLCASGSYDKTLFHRNVRSFMVQGGDPTGTGKGGVSVWGEPFKDEFKLKHDKKGTVSMANRGKPNTNQAQFFVAYEPLPTLNDVYTVFGQVIFGFDTLDRMESEVVGEKDRPVRDIVIQSVTIHANPLAG